MEQNEVLSYAVQWFTYFLNIRKIQVEEQADIKECVSRILQAQASVH